MSNPAQPPNHPVKLSLVLEWNEDRNVLEVTGSSVKLTGTIYPWEYRVIQPLVDSCFSALKELRTK